MKSTLIALALLAAVQTYAQSSDFATAMNQNPYAGGGNSTPAIADGVVLNSAIVENVYLMPEQITKLIFPAPVEEVSVDSLMVSVQANPPTSKENYLLLSPKVAKGDIDMHLVMEGQTFTFRLILGKSMVNYRKTYTIMGSQTAHKLPKVPPLAPSEINTVNLIKMVQQAIHEPNYAQAISKDMGCSPQNRNYLWNGVEVSLLDAWQYYPQDIVILRIEVHNPTSKAIYLSASQIQPFIANTPFDYLLVEQSTKVLLPSQTDVKYIFLQGYRLDISSARFELRLPAASNQLNTPQQ